MLERAPQRSPLLAESQVRERAASRVREQAEHALTGTALARAIRAAVVAETSGRKVAGRKVSKDEQDALAQMVAERLGRRAADGHRTRPATGTAREVLAFIARAERMPTIVARETALARGTDSREYLRQMVSGLLRDSREWRDTANEWRDHRASAEHAALMSLDAALERPDSGQSMLATAQAREQLAAGETVPPLPLADAWQVAQRAADIGEARAAEAAREAAEAAEGSPMAVAWAAAQAGRFPLTARERRAMAAALAIGLPDPADGMRGGVSLAAHIGATYGTTRNLVSAGGKLWRELFPARALAGIVREAAAQVAGTDREGALRRRAARVVAAPWQASLPADAYLDDDGRAAREAVEAAIVRAREREAARSNGGPGETVLRSYRTTRTVWKLRGGTIGRSGKRHGATRTRMVRPVVVPYLARDTRTPAATAITAHVRPVPTPQRSAAGRTFTPPQRPPQSAEAARAVWAASRYWPDAMFAGHAAYSPDPVREAQRLAATGGQGRIAAQREAAREAAQGKR